MYSVNGSYQRETVRAQRPNNPCAKLEYYCYCSDSTGFKTPVFQFVLCLIGEQGAISCHSAIILVYVFIGVRTCDQRTAIVPGVCCFKQTNTRTHKTDRHWHKHMYTFTPLLLWFQTFNSINWKTLPLQWNKGSCRAPEKILN